MKRISTLLIAAVVPVAFAAPSLAEEGKVLGVVDNGPTEIIVAFAAPSLADEGKVLGVVDNGRTEIIFKAADTSDIPMDKLHAWSEFASQHPDIARTLGYHPSLINSDSYLKKHPELAEFFAQHPDIREDMAENPGNYVAPPPRA
jgi:hypothetical protein